MSNKKVQDKEFELFISEEKIQNRVVEIATQINNDYKDKEPVFLGILNGCYAFLGDLMKHINLNCEVSFIKVSTYKGTESTGKIHQLIGLGENISGREIIVVDDILDTGFTLEKIIEELKVKRAKSIKTAALLNKPEALKTAVKADYMGFEIPNKYVIGYGLDYNGYGRNLNGIYQMKS